MTDFFRKYKNAVARIVILIFVMVGFSSFFVFGQKATQEDAELIQTEIGLDQMVATAPAPSSPDSSDSSGAAGEDGAFSVEVRQMKMINESLRNAIEENKKLISENKGMDDELKQLRGSSQVNANRVTFLTNQRDDLQKRMEETERLIQDYTQQIERLKSVMAEKEKEFENRLADIEQETAKEKEREEKAMAIILPRLRDQKEAARANQDLQNLQGQAKETLKNFEDTTQKMTAKVARIERENKKLKLDSVKLHYNLANTFFEQGQYARAAMEYRKVVELMPMDAEAHYNLAFVSGEFLRDYKTAYAHYQQYLFLRPYAEDAAIVNDKILDAQLQLRTTINSSIDKEANLERRRNETTDVSPRKYLK